MTTNLSAYFSVDDADLAEQFMRLNPVGDDAANLVGRVETWLGRVQMGHRDPFAVAHAVLHLAQAKPAPLASSEQNAADQNLAEGVGDTGLDVEAIAALDMAAYSRVRQAQFGMGQRTDHGIFGPIRN